MSISVRSTLSRAADIARPHLVLGSIFGAFSLLGAFSVYPLSYLFVPDREIWIVQVGTWLWLLLKAVAIAAAASLVFGLLARTVRGLPTPLPGVSRRAIALLHGGIAPLVLGAASAAVAAFIWGINPPPVIHDETAYLFQARLFSHGHWVGPPFPVPEFFEQMYVFVTPFTAAKYPPGFSLALVPGIWLGRPVLVPIALMGITGGLLFSLARTVADASTAFLAWLLWTTIPYPQFPSPPFVSQHLSTLLWLAAWWALWRWSQNGRARDLALVAGFVSLDGITRPYTAAALALPIVVVVLVRIFRRGAWAQLAPAAAAGSIVLALIPIWNVETTGNWKTMPLSIHTRWYNPYDILGFRTTFPPPVRKLPDDLAEAAAILGRERRHHAVDRIPFLAETRLQAIRANAFPGWRTLWVPFLVYGFVSGAGCGVAFAAVTLDFVLYLAFAHPARLPLYYIETYPVLAFAAALGIRHLAGGVPSSKSAGVPPRKPSPAIVLLCLLIIPLCASDAIAAHLAQSARQRWKRQFREELQALPGRSLVFVRYPEGFPAFITLIENDPDLKEEKAWVVRDCGAKNDELRAMAPERVPYLYVATRDRFIRLDRPMNAMERKVADEPRAKWHLGMFGI